MFTVLWLSFWAAEIIPGIDWRGPIIFSYHTSVWEGSTGQHIRNQLVLIVVVPAAAWLVVMGLRWANKDTVAVTLNRHVIAAILVVTAAIGIAGDKLGWFN